LSYAIEQCENGFENYHFPQVTTAIYNFWLYELCDVYIEYIKQDFYGKTADLKRQEVVKSILYTCLDNGLRLLAPIMPFVSEELYQRLPKPKQSTSISPSLCVTPYPKWSEVDLIVSIMQRRAIAFSSNNIDTKRLRRMSTRSTRPSTRFVRIDQHKKSSRKRKTIVSDRT
jgi:valyl-tRNA synthetase